jgi:hypothetical protein
MATLREFQRRSVVPIAGLALAGYYLFVLAPLEHHSQSLDAPLKKSWQKLAGSLDQSNSLAIDFLHITNQLNETQMAVGILGDIRQKAAARLALGPVLEARTTASFELVDYENERSNTEEALRQFAKKQGTTVDAAVFAGFPAQTSEVRQPALLWPSLAFVNHLLRRAMLSNVIAIHSLELAPSLTNSAVVENTDWLSAIPVQVELTATSRSLETFLESLPLRAEEIRSAGLPESAPDKPPLFVDRLVIRKQSPDKPDEVRVFLRVAGFVLHE